MQLSTAAYQPLNNETEEMVPPPYQDEYLPQYMDASMELEGIMDRFAPRWDNQRIHHGYYNEKSAPETTVPSTFEKTGRLLDRMEDYRHADQEWTSHNDMKRVQMMNNMYHIRYNNKPKKMPSSLSSSAKSKYYKISLSLAKEREHIIHKMKNMRSSSSKASCKNEFDLFLNSIHHTSSQFEMANQRATLVIPTI